MLFKTARLCPRYHFNGPPPPPQKCAKLVSHKIRVGGAPPPSSKVCKTSLAHFRRGGPPPPQKCAKLPVKEGEATEAL